MVVPAYEPESGAGAWVCARAGKTSLLIVIPAYEPESGAGA